MYPLRGLREDGDPISFAEVAKNLSWCGFYMSPKVSHRRGHERPPSEHQLSLRTTYIGDPGKIYPSFWKQRA